MNPFPATSKPAWYDPAKVVLDLDVTALLAAGEHPLARVKQAVAQSAPGEIVALRSGFRPEPLISIFQSDGIQVWCGREGALFLTCICKPQ